MLRKILITGSLTAILSTSVCANGLYIGIGVGPDFAKFQDNANIQQIQNGNLNFNVRNTTQLAATGVFGTLFAGYGMPLNGFLSSCMNHLYIAGELNANLSSLEHKTSNDEIVHKNFTTTKFKMQHSYGVSIIPGYLYTNATLFYGRLGYSKGNFRVTTTDISLKNTNQNLDGFRWGFGMQQTIAQHFSVRMDYSHVNYRGTNLSTLDTLSNTAKSTRITPQTNEVEFSLLYTFC